MKHLLLLFVLLAFSCKKEDPTPITSLTSNSKAALLEIEFRTLGSGMTTTHDINHVVLDDSYKNANYFKFDTVVAGGQFFMAYITSPVNNYNEILIKFNGDTLIYTDTIYGKLGANGILPIIP